MTRNKRALTRKRVDGCAAEPEQGFTLVELIVYLALFLIVLIVIAGILISSLKSEKVVRSAAEASSLGQLIANAVQKDARNATALNVSSPNTGIADSQMLVMSTLKGDVAGTSVCSAWLYVPVHGGQLFTAKSTAKISVPWVADLTSTPADKAVRAPTGWSSYGEGITPRAGADGVVPRAGTDGIIRPAGAQIFTLFGQELTIAFDVSAPERKAVPISTSETSRQTLTGTSICF